MHQMQKYILDRLRIEQPLGYSEMMPKGTESSHFMYHLKLLVKDGLVQKLGRGTYQLTDAGLAAVEYMSMGRLTPAKMPKVITYTLLTHSGELLLLRKQKEPYRGLVEPVAGKLHFGEDSPQAAQREVHEKFGLNIKLPTFVGIADMKIFKDEALLTHMIVFAHTAELDALPALAPNMAMVTSLEPKDSFVPGTVDLIKAVQTAKRPFVISIRAKTV